eukprot:m.82837 g.82837  ORF g.82837 m.82837 type:complete len:213 (-) comp12890_c0_seq1:206-844(-)
MAAFATSFVALAACVALSSAASIKLGPFSGVPAVPELNATAYLGRWYQMYGDTVVDKTFEKGDQCVTADYGVNPNGTVSVLNQARLTSPTGAQSIIHGWAQITDPSKPAQLTVHLQGVPVPAPYWVIQLGPQNYAGPGCTHAPCYTYAVVSDQFEASLFVLARNPTIFKATYEATVLSKLKEQGFTKFFDKPEVIYQGSDCQYLPPPNATSL